MRPAGYREQHTPGRVGQAGFAKSFTLLRRGGSLAVSRGFARTPQSDHAPSNKGSTGFRVGKDRGSSGNRVGAWKDVGGSEGSLLFCKEGVGR